MFSIKSSSSDRELQFCDLGHEAFTVSLVGQSPQAKLRVCTYTDELGLLAFFKDLGAQPAPWGMERSWGSLEGEFHIQASCSPLGQVTFRATLLGNVGMEEEWRVSIGLQQEFGALEGLAQKASAFFAAAAPNNSLQARRP